LDASVGKRRELIVVFWFGLFSQKINRVTLPAQDLSASSSSHRFSSVHHQVDAMPKGNNRKLKTGEEKTKKKKKKK
jgi:hypothetical protein